MPIKLKTINRKSKRLGISGLGGCGKSTATVKAYKKPIIFDLEKKFPIKEQELWPLPKSVNYTSLTDELFDILDEPVAEVSGKGFDALVIDSLSEIETICETHAISKDYKGDRSAYSSYSRGPNNELAQYFNNITKILSDIQDKHDIDICLIIHNAPAVEQNPMGEDYTKIKLDLKKRPYSITMKWLDCLGCVYDEAITKKDGLKYKVTGSTRKISFDNANPMFDGKRLGMTEVTENFDTEGQWYIKLFNKGVK